MGAGPAWSGQLFRQALVNPPFPNTLADPNVPTPAGGTVAEQGGNNIAGSVQVPQPSISPGDPAVAKRLKMIDDDLAHIEAVAQAAVNWQPEIADSFARRLQLVFTGKFVPEARVLQIKSQALSDLMGQAQGLIQERRLLTRPNPYEEEQMRALGKASVENWDRGRREQFLNQLEKSYGIKIDPISRGQFIETGYGLNKNDQGEGPEKIYTLAEKMQAANIGKTGGKKAAAALPAELQPFAIGAAEEEERAAADKKKRTADGEDSPWAGYSNKKELVAALDRTAQDIMRAPENVDYVPVDTGERDIMGNPQKVLKPSYKITLAEARRQALARLGVAVDLLPGYPDGVLPEQTGDKTKPGGASKKRAEPSTSESVLERVRKARAKRQPAAPAAKPKTGG